MSVSCHGLVSVSTVRRVRQLGSSVVKINRLCVMKRKGVSPLLRVRYSVQAPVADPALSSKPVETERAGEVVQHSVLASSSGTVVKLAARSDAPVLAPSSKGVKRKALEAGHSESGKELAMLALQKDMNAQSAVASRESLLKTCLQFHQTWFGQG